MTDARDRYLPAREPLHIVPQEVDRRASERQILIALVDKVDELVSATNRIDNDIIDLSAARIVDDGHRRRLSEAVDRLTKRLDGPEVETRARQASSQDIQVAADELRAATEAITEATGELEELTNPGTPNPLRRPSTPSDPVRNVAAGLWLMAGRLLASGAGKALEHGATALVTAGLMYAVARALHLLR